MTRKAWREERFPEKDSAEGFAPGCLGFAVQGLQGYLAHKKTPSPIRKRLPELIRKRLPEGGVALGESGEGGDVGREGERRRLRAWLFGV